MRIIFILFVLINTFNLYSQDITIKILNNNDEVLINANVQINNKDVLSTDNKGIIHYTSDSNKDSINLKINYIGCSAIDTTINIRITQSIKIKLNCTVLLNEAVISAYYPVKRNTAVVLRLPQIKNQPVLFGEPDIFKTLQNKSGINFAYEGSSDFVVRGGGIGENLIILDNVPVYTGSHLLGLLTSFDVDYIKRVKIYKNGFPAKYSGRLSSVIDIETKKFDDIDKALKVKIGPISNSIYYSNSLNNKIKFEFSARKTLIDVFSLTYSKIFTENREKFIPNFYDIYLKLISKFNKNNQISISLTYPFDKILDGNYEKGQNSLLKTEGITRWSTPNYLINYYYVKNKAKIDISAGRTLYNYRGGLEELNIQKSDTSYYHLFSYKTSNTKTTLSTGISYLFNDKTKLSFGSKYQSTRLNVNSSDSFKNQYTNDSIATKSDVLHNYLSLNYESKFTSSNVGISILTFPDINYKTYIEPRVYLDLRLNRNKIYFSYSQMHQSELLIANRSIANYLKTWFPANSKYLPSKSTSYSIGYEYNVAKNINFNIELYYKQRNNLVYPKEGDLNYIMSKNIDGLLTNGKGVSKGFEISGYFKIGRKHKFDISYNLSKSSLLFPDLNNGNVFPDYFDRTHILKILYSLKINEHWSVFSQFTFMTGTPFTYITSMYPGPLFSPDQHVQTSGSVPNNVILYFENINNKRLPNYHRLDINTTKSFIFKKYPALLSFGIYNIYAHINPMFVEIRKSESFNPNIPNQYQKKLKYNIVSYFNFIPYINFTLTLK